MTSPFEHQRFAFKRKYMMNLISLAASDGRFDDNEKKLIQSIGEKRGLKPWQIEELLQNAVTDEFFIPETLPNRLNLLFDLMELIHIDGKVNEKEVDFISGVVEKFQLPIRTVEQLFLLFQNGTPPVPEWYKFLEYVKEEVEAGNVPG
jgi:uncharacterized tellurite resistance protein B-like protein